MSDTDTKAIKALQGATTRAAAKQAAAATASSVTPSSTDDVGNEEGTSPRASGRRRSLSFLAHEALTNKWSEEEFETALARSMQVFKGGRAAAPSTAQVAANSHTAVLPSSSQSSSSLPPRAVGSRTNTDDPLHGLNAALALATNRESRSNGGNDIAAEPPSSRRGHDHAIPIPPRMVTETAANGNCNSIKDGHTHRHRRERHRHSRHRSRSRSSSSSPDHYTRDKHSLYYKGQRIRARDQWHLSSAARVLANYWSFSDWYGNNKLKVKRNAFEAEELCAIIDEIRWGSEWAEHGDMVEAAHHYALALEIASRRLEGVVRADEAGHWEHANALSLLKRTELGNAQQIRDLNSDISRARSAGNTTSSSSSSLSYVPQQQPTVWRGGNRPNRGRGGGRGGGGRGRGGNANNGGGKATDNKSSGSDNTATK